MVRRYDELIEVRTAPVAGADDGPAAPVAFVWRDRLYVVRSVVSHWYERRVWWREAAASALLGLRSDVQLAAQGAAVTGRSSATLLEPALSRPERADRPGAPGAAVAPAEREVWRVEAAAGRSSPVGVYDLVLDPAIDPVDPAGDGPGTWRLARLAD
ncbi:DUF6504 family protein [Angustibacter sp. Root456]|uniref:DUF6504 family protein n=1 Tax=Angustibacter sp. Root456 TaxID=1736539 RepID=UPI0006F88B51|nr:hypothetical protein ASD06_10800 [Angustibacter sp. Root456]